MLTQRQAPAPTRPADQLGEAAPVRRARGRRSRRCGTPRGRRTPRPPRPGPAARRAGRRRAGPAGRPRRPRSPDVSRARRSSSSGQTRLASQALGIGIGHVERVQVDPGPPADRRDARRAAAPARAPGRSARAPRRAAARRRRRRWSSGRRSGRDRGRARRSHRPRPARAARRSSAAIRAKSGTSVASRPTSLVWVRRSRIVRADRAVVTQQGLAQTGVRAGRRHPVPAGGREHDVRLTLQRRQRVDPREHLGIGGDPAPPRVEARRDWPAASSAKTRYSSATSPYGSTRPPRRSSAPRAACRAGRRAFPAARVASRTESRHFIVTTHGSLGRARSRSMEWSL